MTNNGTTPVMVTLILTVEADPTTSERAMGGYGTSNGWAYVAFQYTAGTSGLRYTGTREIAGGQTVPAPTITVGFAQTAFGASTMTLTVPSPATATNPAPAPFTAYTGPALRSARTTGPTSPDFTIEP